MDTLLSLEIVAFLGDFGHSIGPVELVLLLLQTFLTVLPFL